MASDELPHVARYRLRDRLGAGGLGVVYAADDPELGRRVAVKLIRIGRTDDAGFARLHREATALARVSHPHVVGVFDVGRYRTPVGATWPEDVPRRGAYIVMELVEGTNLHTWLQTLRPVDEVLEVFTAAGRGLAAAHGAGVVHRDFKPANVVLDAEGRVKVLDFGLAQWLHFPATPTSGSGTGSADPDTGSATMTVTGSVMGTPAYMAPEQHRGERADARTDQFSYCVALTEALTGARPFAGDTVAELHAAKEKLALESGPRDVPTRLRPILRRGLAVSPDDRWPSMNALLDEIGRTRSRAGWWVAGTIAAGLGLSGWALSLSDPPPTTTAAPAAEPREPDAYEPSPAATALRRAAQEAWVDPATTPLDDVLEPYDLEALPEDASLAAEVLLWRGRQRHAEESAKLLRQAFFLAQEAKVPSTAARAAGSMANAIVADHGAAVAEWTRHALAELDRGPWDRTAAIEVAVMETYGRAIAVPDEVAEDALQRAFAIVGDLEPDDTAYVAHLLTQLSAAARYVGNEEGALAWGERALTLIDRVGHARHPVRAAAEEEIGLSLDLAGRCDEALPHLSRAESLYLADGPDAHAISVALIRGHIGDCLRELDRVEPALLEYEAALPYWLEDTDDFGIQEIRTLMHIARLDVRLGRTAAAIEAYEQAITVVNPLGPDHPLREQARTELAELRASSAKRGGR